MRKKNWTSWILTILFVCNAFLGSGCGTEVGTASNGDNMTAKRQNTEKIYSKYLRLKSDEARDIIRKNLDDKKTFLILDVRTKKEFEEGHIPHAVNFPNEEIQKGDESEFPSILKQNKKNQIFVYCRSGNRSKKASEKLTNMGYSHIIEFGGINDWKGEIVR